jgi:hypothetical protein
MRKIGDIGIVALFVFLICAVIWYGMYSYNTIYELREDNRNILDELQKANSSI